jgi:hypothetical protein
LCWRRREHSGVRPELLEQFGIIGELACLVFAVNEFAVHGDVEHAAGTFDQFGIGAELLLDFFRQTGGSRAVVSHAAVLDRNFHLSPPGIDISVSSSMTAHRASSPHRRV